MNSRLKIALGLTLAISFATAVLQACGKNSSCQKQCCISTPTPSSTATASHPLRGIVQSVVAERQSILVKHEAIPDVMSAMTMLLQVDPGFLNQVAVGDTITARLFRNDDGKWALEKVIVAKN